LDEIRACMFLTEALYTRNSQEDKNRSVLRRAFQIASQLDSQHVLVESGRKTVPLLKALNRDQEIGKQVKGLLSQIEQLERALPKIRRHLRERKLSISFAPPKLRFQALGQMQIFLDDKPLTDWQAQVLRDFIFCLLAHPRGLTKEQIGLLFWPDCSPAQLKVRFKKTIYRLRRVLGQEVVVFDQERYWFNQQIDYEYDVDIFWGKLRKADRTTTIEEKIGLYQEAVDTYRGSYLPNMDATWVLAEREKLWRAYADTKIKIGEYYWNIGNCELALASCQRILEIDPCLEAAHRLLMHVYHQLGRQDQVARQYQQCQQALEEELGVTPSPQTVRLFQILTH
jgi:LuxR family maltose regulon positive regulatory protein